MPDTDEQVKQDEKPADALPEREAVEARVESPAPPPAERVAERTEAREARTEAPPEARTDGGARAERTDRPERHERGPRPTADGAIVPGSASSSSRGADEPATGTGPSRARRLPRWSARSWNEPSGRTPAIPPRSTSISSSGAGCFP